MQAGDNVFDRFEDVGHRDAAVIHYTHRVRRNILQTPLSQHLSHDRSFELDSWRIRCNPGAHLPALTGLNGWRE